MRSRRALTPAEADATIAQRLLRKRTREAPEPVVEAADTRCAAPEPVQAVEEPMCSICLTELSAADHGTTHCGHKFHSACLASWMLVDRKHSCPECRAHVGASATRSRMFLAEGEQPRQTDGTKRMPRFHGG